MKKLICEVDEDYLNELCEAFKKYPMGGIPTHRAWALLEGLKNGIVLDGLTNGEVIRKMFSNAKVAIDGTTVCLKFEYYHEIWFDLDWWNAKWGE